MGRKGVYYRKPPPLHRRHVQKKKKEVPCIGHYCWEKGKTFMSPDPTRIRMCLKCQTYADAHPEGRINRTYQKSTKGGTDV